ncbi:hypothetical protein C8R45DRAFT_1207689 [Mycena sanguinolenta]|nr:hypothetical protein C8R45DRAFT_1207689 [Mycena sanguinolenta]
MAVPRRIVVDDTDTAIKYSPNQWFSGDVTQLNTLGNLGAVWNGTIHNTVVNGATFSFAFNGTAIDVLGTIQINTLTDGTPDPQWVCLVDEIEIANGTNPTFNFPENNWVLCNQDTLLAGPHNLTLKVQSKNTPFYFDSIQYIPTPDVSFDGAVLALDASDPAISYGPGWEFYTVENTQNITQTNGSHVTLNFHGTAATLTGYVPQELPHNSTTGEYTVDGGPATKFTIAGLPANDNTTAFNIPMLSVSGLTPATHNLVVTYLGDEQHTPLVVKTWIITNSTTPAVAVPPSSSSSSKSVPTHSTPAVAASKHTPTGAIAGGIVGALALIGLLAGLLFWLRRRNRWPDDTPHRPANGEPRFAIDTVEAGAGGASPSFVGGSIATGYATQGTGAASSHATTQDPFDPYAESGAGGSSSNRMPFSPNAAAPSTGGTTPYPYPYVAVPHARTLSSESASASGSSVQPQASASAPSSSGGGAGAAAALIPRNGALAPLTPQRTKSQEARMGQPQRRVVVQRHQDSGVRLHNGSTPSLLPEEVVVEELPPDYSRD